jgi:hypothetical protein
MVRFLIILILFVIIVCFIFNIKIDVTRERDVFLWYSDHFSNTVTRKKIYLFKL